MRRIGLALVVLGAILYLVAASKRGGYDSFEGSMRTTFSQSEREKRDFWGSARIVALVAAGAGAVLVFVSRKAP